MCPPGRASTYSDVQGPANQQTSFSGRDDECAAHKLPFSGHIIKKFRGPSILQLNIKGLTASKMNVLHHLATQLETFVILLQETHCISSEKLVLSNYQLAGFSLSRKHGLSTFVHERLKWTLYDQSPTTLETAWFCVDVDGYKIVNIYKPPPTRLQVSDLPVFTHPCLDAGDFNCPHVDWGYNTNIADGDCLLAWASSNNLALLHDPKDEPSFHSGRWNTGTNPDLAFTTVGPDSRLPYRRVLEKLPRSQHRPSLITPPRLSLPVPEYYASVWYRSAHTRLIDSVFNNALRIVSGCLRPTPTDYLPVLAGIQPAELRRLRVTLSLAYRGSLDPGHILYELLAGFTHGYRERLKSRRPFVPAARKLLQDPTELDIRAAQWTDFKWSTKYSECSSDLCAFIPRTSTRPMGMGLPRSSWVRLNRLRAGVGCFQ